MRPPSRQVQCARRLLSQATMQRSHRRSELIRLIPDSVSANESVMPHRLAPSETRLTSLEMDDPPDRS